MSSLFRYDAGFPPVRGACDQSNACGQNSRHDRAAARSGFDLEASVYGNQSLPDAVQPEPAFDGGHPERPRVKPHTIVCDLHPEMSVVHVEQDMGILRLAVLHDIVQQLPDQLVENRFHIRIYVLECIPYVANNPNGVSFHQPVSERFAGGLQSQVE